MNTSVDFDIVVVGGGAVGSLLALLASNLEVNNLNIALVDPYLSNDPISIATDTLSHPQYWQNKSQRVSAINTSLVSILEIEIGKKFSQVVAPMSQMQVFSPECGGHFHVDATEYGHAALASVISNRVLNDVLLHELQQKHNITFISESFKQLQYKNGYYRLFLEQSQVRCRFLVAADGARSKVRQQLLIPEYSKGKDTFAISAQGLFPGIANTSCAYQWFFADGSVVGLLPVAGSSSSDPIFSIVWSQAPEEKMSEITALALEKKLHRCGLTSSYGELLRSAQIISTPEVWPLKRKSVQAKNIAKAHPQLFLIGDAAHVIHPLAGQGLNLGLQDAVDLCETLKAILVSHKSTRFESEQFIARRSRDAEKIMQTCEGLSTFFAQKSWPARALGAFAFRQFDRHKVFKKVVVSHMSF